MKKIIGVVTIILGIISCIMFFNAGSKLNDTGQEMKELRSQSGTSLAEAYYQEVGSVSEGLGKLCYAIGVGTLTISVGIGGNLCSTKNTIVD